MSHDLYRLYPVRRSKSGAGRSRGADRRAEARARKKAREEERTWQSGLFGAWSPFAEAEHARELAAHAAGRIAPSVREPAPAPVLGPLDGRSGQRAVEQAFYGNTVKGVELDPVTGEVKGPRR